VLGSYIGVGLDWHVMILGFTDQGLNSVCDHVFSYFLFIGNTTHATCSVGLMILCIFTNVQMYFIDFLLYFVVYSVLDGPKKIM